MPVVFLFSAIVSGIALMLVVYFFTTMLRSKPVDMACMDKLGAFLLYALIVDFSLEMLDFTQRLYEAEESISILGQMLSNRLVISLIVLQIIVGTIVPLVTLFLVAPTVRKRGFIRVPDEFRRLLYFVVAVLIQIGIFSTRWNVVIGGQLFSKSLRGLTTYKLNLLGIEGILVAGATGRAEPLLTWWGFAAANLAPVTFGNVVGGVLFVAFAYWYIHLSVDGRRDREERPAAGK